MKTTAAPRIAALALSTLFTALMVIGVDHIATTQQSSGLLAQSAPPAVSAPAKT